MKKTQIFLIAILALMAFSAGVYFSVEQEVGVSEQTHLYKQPRAIDDFVLTTQTGASFSNGDLEGKWSFLFLGYLSCPDVCPTTMMKLSGLIPQLEEVAPNTQVLFLSVDPKRDKVENIRDYTNYFHQSILGLRAEHKALYPFVRNLGLMYSIPPAEVEDGYYVDHSGSVVLINPQGEIHAMFKPEVELGQVPSINPTTMLEDFKLISVK
ncbi:SCO family protein [Psychrosphaera aestuarii]|uniref:SCO family protein n=1 Tax=Psychrosphaera aestuarii TaxID=1266052 RepID=UPI001B31F4FD|nr:SCO family protein [Psychrosphaera aestuarii]